MKISTTSAAMPARPLQDRRTSLSGLPLLAGALAAALALAACATSSPQQQAGAKEK